MRRSLVGRLFATTLQGYLTVAAALSAAALIGAFAQADRSLWPYLIAPVLLIALWLRGVTAWARVDDGGLHWRYWTRWDHPWDTVSKLTLTRRAVFGHHGTGGSPVIVVRSKGGDEDVITPARSCGRHRREFGAAVLVAARAHGIRAEVVSTGWDEPPTHLAEPWE